jgi:hypothetical protein
MPGVRSRMSLTAMGWASTIAFSSSTVTLAELRSCETGARKAVTTMLSSGASSAAWAIGANREEAADSATKVERRGRVAIRGTVEKMRGKMKFPSCETARNPPVDRCKGTCAVTPR